MSTQWTLRVQNTRVIGLVFARLTNPPEAKSFLLLGPRGTGKSSWVRQRFADAVYVNLLESDVYTELLAAPSRLEQKIPPWHRGWVVIDDIQKVPALLDEVHRLIERRKLKFALTGSSARTLRRRGVNLLAGRARFSPRTSRPTCARRSCRRDSRAIWARSHGSWGASPSRRACRSTSILEDLLVAVRLPSFQKRAKRRVATHPKFFFFDTGVYRAIRPRGPLDSPEEIDGPAFETLLMQELRAHVAYRDLGYELFYWRTSVGVEVDLVLYGERGLHAFEVKRASRLRQADFAGLRAFRADNPTARCTLAYSGTKRYTEGAIEIVPLDQLLAELPARL